jgi:molecular chaperone GrpE
MDKERKLNKSSSSNNYHSGLMINYDENPFSNVETDIYNLMKKYGEVLHNFENYKSEKKAEIKKMLLNFIDVVDSFKKIFKNIGAKEDYSDKQTKIWIGNFHTVYKLLLRALKMAGVTPLEVVIGEKANPYWHNVVEVVRDPNREDETIVEEIEKGYLWNGELLRATDVKTVKNN